MNLPHNSSTSAMKQREDDPEIYKSLYRDKEIPLPNNYVPRAEIVDHKLPLEIHRVEGRQSSYDYVNTPESVRERLIRHMQGVTGVDKLVGVLLDELKKQGLDRETIIIYSSDHGIFNGEFGLGGKALCYEYCTHVPLIIYDPSLPKRQRSQDNNELISSIDIAPTILDYAGVKRPEGYQGATLRPLIEGEVESVRDYLYTENLWSTHFGNPRCESVQDKEWKYIRYYKNENMTAPKKLKIADEFGLSSKIVYANDITSFMTYRDFIDAGLNGEEAAYEELYNLKDDPKEITNLAGNPKYQAKLESLRKEWYKQLKYARGTGLPMVNIKLDKIVIPD